MTKNVSYQLNNKAWVHEISNNTFQEKFRRIFFSKTDKFINQLRDNISGGQALS